MSLYAVFMICPTHTQTHKQTAFDRLYY